jgi:hypothetical protein
LESLSSEGRLQLIQSRRTEQAGIAKPIGLSVRRASGNGNFPPTEADANFYVALDDDAMAA